MGERLGTMDAVLRLNQRLAKAETLDRTRSKLRFVRLVLWYEIAFGVLACLLIGSYLFDHLGAIRFALPAAVLHLGAILALGAAVRQLVALGHLDYAGPVVQIQRRLAELHALRARSNRWLLLSSPMIWALLIIVVPHGLIGLDAYRAFGLPWVAGNLAFGIAVLCGVAWICRRFPAATQNSKILRSLGDDITGRRVAAVSAFLEDLKVFEAGE
jgi:hypothetical protein